MAYLGDLLVRLKAETAEFQSDMGKAAHVAEKNMRQIESVVDKASAAIGALGVAGFLTAKVMKMQEVIDTQDHINKLSQRVGVAVEDLSGMRFAADLAGVEIESLGTSLQKLNVNMADALAGGEKSKVFEVIGISAKDSSGRLKSARDVMLEVADKFAVMQDGAAKTAIAVEIFGKSGAAMIPMLNGGAEALRQMDADAKKLGLTFGDDAAKASEAFNDNLRTLQLATEGGARAMVNDYLPALVKITTAMRDAAIEGGFLKGVLAGAQTFLTGDDKYKAQKDLVNYTDKLIEAQNILDMQTKRLGKDSPQTRIAEQRVAEYRALANQAAGYLSIMEGEEKRIADLEKKRDEARKKNDGSDILAKLNALKTKGIGGAAKVKDDGYLDSVFKAATSDLNALQKLLDKTPIEKTRELLDNIAKLDTAFFNGAISPQLYDQAITALTGKLEDGAKATEKLREAGARVFAETRTPLESFYIKMDELNMLLEAGAIDWDTYERAGGKALEAIATKGEDTFKDLEHAIRGWGNSFTNTLADIVTGGKADFNDLANSIIRDLARIQIQRNITDPLLKAGTGMLDGLFKGSSGPEQLSGPTDSGGGFFDSISNFLGFKADGGPVSANGSYVVGERGPELFTPDVAGNITPNHALGGTSVTSVNHFHIDARSDQASIMAAVSAIVRQNDARTRDNLARRGQRKVAGAMA